MAVVVSEEDRQQKRENDRADDCESLHLQRAAEHPADHHGKRDDNAVDQQCAHQYGIHKAKTVAQKDIKANRFSHVPLAAARVSASIGLLLFRFDEAGL